jgi:hypothetical protein
MGRLLENVIKSSNSQKQTVGVKRLTIRQCWYEGKCSGILLLFLYIFNFPLCYFVFISIYIYMLTCRFMVKMTLS